MHGRGGPTVPEPQLDDAGELPEPPGDRDSLPPAPPLAPDLAEELERERSKARRSAAHARNAERDALDALTRIAQLTAQLEAEQRRNESFRRSRSVRLAARIAGAVRGVVFLGGRRLTARPRIRIRPRPEPPSPRAFPDAAQDPRSLPRVYRETLLAILHAPAETKDRLRVTVVGPPALPREPLAVDYASLISVALGARGFDVTRTTRDPDPGADVVIVTVPSVDPMSLPSDVIRVGWLPAAPDPGSTDGVGEWDIVLGSVDHAARDFVDAVDRWLTGTRVSIRAPAGNAQLAPNWGDTYLARDLRAAFRKAGWPARIHFRTAWNDPAVGRDDVVLDLLGIYEAETRVGACRVLWQISHPELASAELYATYDAVFVASESFARFMAEDAGMAVHPLNQATDPARFNPDAPGPAHELLVVANWRSGGRQVVSDLVPTEHELAVYGRDWTPERLDPRYHAADHIANDELGSYYAAATIVLNDHWAGMQREGFLSNRLYDAAAAGAFVISDDVEGLEAEFDGGIVGYRDRAHLRDLIDTYLADGPRRRACAKRARRAVLQRHTFDHRAARIAEIVTPLLREAEATEPGS
jgi:hypothetical protein